MKAQLTSDGTCINTHISVDGVELHGIRKVSFELDACCSSEACLVIEISQPVVECTTGNLVVEIDGQPVKVVGFLLENGDILK